MNGRTAENVERFMDLSLSITKTHHFSPTTTTCLVTCGSRAQSEMDLGLFCLITKWRLTEFLAWNIFKNLSRTL